MKTSASEIELTIKAQRRRMELAISEYETEKSKLYYKGGQPYYADDLMKEKKAELLAQLEETKAEAIGRINEALQGVDGIIAQAAYPDITEGLSLVDMEKLSARAQFVKEDVEELPYAELATAIKAAVARGDDVELRLYQRYALRKLERERRDEIATSDPDFFMFLHAAKSLPSNKVDTSEFDDLRKTARDIEMQVRRMFDEATGGVERAQEAAAEFTRLSF